MTVELLTNETTNTTSNSVEIEYNHDNIGLVQVIGTMDTAVVDIEMSLDDGTNYHSVSSISSVGIQEFTVKNTAFVRAKLSSVGASTSITVKIMYN